MNEFIEKFISGYKALNEKTRYDSRGYNNLISNNKYVMIHPMIIDNDNIQLIVFFTDDNTKVWPVGEDLQREVFEYIEGTRKYFTFVNCKEQSDLDCINETIYIETSRFSKIELTIARWSDLINAPKLRDGSFSDLSEPFEKFFNLENDYDVDIDYWKVFADDKKPEQLELREVIHDVDSYQKYGTIKTNIYWCGEFIGWYTFSGRWLDTKTYSTVNPEKWKELMYVMLDISGYVIGERLNGVEVYVMDDNDDVESITSVPGFTEPEYGG